MKVLIADITIYEDECLYQEHCGILPTGRQEQIGRYRCKRDKYRGVGAGVLLEYGLNQYGCTLNETRDNYELVHLAQGKFGKPYIAEKEQLCFNLTHAKDYVAAVFAPCDVGIDIEQICQAKLKVAKRFFTDEEYRYLMTFDSEKSLFEVSEGAAQDITAQDAAFFRMWTRKESYIKAVGEGMHLPLTDFSVLKDQIRGRDVYYLRTWEMPEQYAVSVCAKERIDTDISRIELKKSI